MINIRKYNWVLYLIGVLISIISNFFPTIYSTQPIYSPEDFFLGYFFGFEFRGEIGSITFSPILLAVSLFPLILLIISIVKISYLSLKLAMGKDVNPALFLIYATLLMGAVVSYFLIMTISSASIADRIYTIWDFGNPGFGLIGPLIGAIIVYLGYFLRQYK